MMKFEAAESMRSVKLRQAMSVVGIEERDFVDIERTDGKLQNLRSKGKAFIEKEIAAFLAAYGRRGRNLPDCAARTEFILSKLSDRPVYYLWRNARIKLKISPPVVATAMSGRQSHREEKDISHREHRGHREN
jgi:hypothetical protein